MESELPPQRTKVCAAQPQKIPFVSRFDLPCCKSDRLLERRKYLRPHGDHANEQRNRRQRGSFFDNGAEHEESLLEGTKDEHCFCFVLTSQGGRTARQNLRSPRPGPDPGSSMSRRSQARCRAPLTPWLSRPRSECSATAMLVTHSPVGLGSRAGRSAANLNEMASAIEPGAPCRRLREIPPIAQADREPRCTSGVG
jgi:hypothetical protein